MERGYRREVPRLCQRADTSRHSALAQAVPSVLSSRGPAQPMTGRFAEVETESPIVLFVTGDSLLVATPRPAENEPADFTVTGSVTDQRVKVADHEICRRRSQSSCCR